MIQHAICGTWFSTHDEISRHIHDQLCPAIDYHEALYKVRPVDVDGIRIFAGGPRGMAAKRRKWRKQARRAIARANRIAREGIRPEDVACPRCGAQPNLRTDDHNFCTRDGINPTPRHQYHRARYEAAAALKDSILKKGENARHDLALLTNHPDD